MLNMLMCSSIELSPFGQKQANILVCSSNLYMEDCRVEITLVGYECVSQPSGKISFPMECLCSFLVQWHMHSKACVFPKECILLHTLFYIQI